MFLIIGAVLSAIVAVLHIGIIIFGAPWYRFFGAGEKMAILAEQGSMRPTVITSLIAIVLATWSLYALSGAGAIGRLPLLRLGLSVITAIYLARGVLGFFLMNNPMGRSPEFWVWSSAICLVIGLVYLIGLIQVW
ncbi:MAG: hypothetical protein GXP04_01135, partial [Alphaproteobacteria bacterium]|nr:hypothetical protein [Alphaproteobacteria bacterium]